MKISEDEIIVKLLDMPTTAREFVSKNDDDTYTIVINSKLSETMQSEAYKHALEHIENSDWEKSDVQSIEAHRHNISPIVAQVESSKSNNVVNRKRKSKRNRRYEEYARKSILLHEYGYEPAFYSIYDSEEPI